MVKLKNRKAFRQSNFYVKFGVKQHRVTIFTPFIAIRDCVPQAMRSVAKLSLAICLGWVPSCTSNQLIILIDLYSLYNYNQVVKSYKVIPFYLFYPEVSAKFAFLYLLFKISGKITWLILSLIKFIQSSFCVEHTC